MAKTMTGALDFLGAASADPELAAAIGDADGDLTALEAIAARAGYTYAEEDLVAAYDEWMRTSGDGGAPSDLGHPIVYLAA
jgi:hypothetical protein